MSSTVVTDKDGLPTIIPLFADPPLHTPFRKLLNPNFPPEVVGRLEQGIREIAVEMIDGLVALGEVDLSDAFTSPYPTRVLCRFLGVSDEDWPVHHEFVMAVNEFNNGGLAEPDSAGLDKPFADIVPYIQKVIAEHRDNPRDDIVQSFIEGEVDGRSLSDLEIIKLTIAMMLAGHATTTAALSNLILRLAQDKQLQDRLRAEPHRIADAIEECLRIDTPQQALNRRCMVDTELGGQTIAAGEFVLTNYGSANVDPKRFPDPGTFNIDREDKNHLAFGFGMHACLGQHLARLDLRIAIEELLARTKSFCVSGDVQRVAYPVLSVVKMPLALESAEVANAS
ncbi:cytochrome P450 [Rhodococcus erythropolis]|uniref:cytochrome P450 n=1 Tax=Rhodococcus erythropolis TaxID=1833 RepID=UPI001428AD7A|nr:cytochrome P450 [Rhodococcus erythropolis]